MALQSHWKKISNLSQIVADLLVELLGVLASYSITVWIIITVSNAVTVTIVVCFAVTIKTNIAITITMIMTTMTIKATPSISSCLCAIFVKNTKTDTSS